MIAASVAVRFIGSEKTTVIRAPNGTPTEFGAGIVSRTRGGVASVWKNVSVWLVAMSTTRGVPRNSREGALTETSTRLRERDAGAPDPFARLRMPYAAGIHGADPRTSVVRRAISAPSWAT